MQEVNIANALYRISKTRIHVGNTQTGKKLSPGAGLSSKGYAQYTTTSGYRCTISAIAILFDLLFLDKKRICAYQLKDDLSVIIQIDNHVYLFQGTVIKTCSVVNLHEILIADAINFMAVTAYGDDELKSQFDFIKRKIARKEMVDEEDVGKFCDIYYQLRKSVNKLIYDDSLTIEEINAAIRTTSCYQLESFKGIDDLAEPVFTIRASKKTSKTAKMDDEKVNQFMQKCINGKYIVNYPWKEEQKEFIRKPEILNEYVPNAVFMKVLKKILFRTKKVITRINQQCADITNIENNIRESIIGNDYINITLIGKPGTGKTETLNALSAATGMPIYVTSGSHNTEEDEFQGMTKMVDGVPTSVPTDALTCFENGGIFVLEEANLILPAVLMGALGQAVEYPFILKKYGYQTIRRHPLCIFVTTMNIGTIGSKQVSQPFANRFRQTYEMNDPEEDIFIKILMTHGAEKERASWVYQTYQSIIKSIEEDNPMADTESILLSLSLRSCIGALENIEEGNSPKEAIRDSIINKIKEQDLEVASHCEELLDALPNLQI